MNPIDVPFLYRMPIAASLAVFIVIMLAATIHLIVDFDRSMRGFIRISQKPMISAVSDMEARLEKR